MASGSEGGCVLVSGGAGALGRHVVDAFLDDGARVHVPVLDSREEGELAAHLGSRSGDVRVHREANLADAEVVERIFEDIEASGDGAPGVLLNIAGGFTMAPVEETAPETWRRMLDMNATTAFLCSRAAFPRMKRAGGGRIVTIAALPALERGQAGLSAYGAAKAAVLNLTGTLSQEGVEHGITVNAILPSIIDTPANREAMPDADTSAWVPPGEIAGICRFLASDAARTLTGAALTLRLD